MYDSRASTAKKVTWLRDAYGIKSACPLGPASCPTGQRGDGRSSAHAAAELLNVTVYTIADWGKSGKRDGVQMSPRGPWWVVLHPESMTALRKPVRQYKPRRAKTGPQSDPDVAKRGHADTGVSGAYNPDSIQNNTCCNTGD